MTRQDLTQCAKKRGASIASSPTPPSPPLEAAGFEVNRKGTLEALEPFAREAVEWPAETDFGLGRSDTDGMLIGVTDDDVGRAAFTVGDLRRARAALSATQQDATQGE